MTQTADAKINPVAALFHRWKERRAARKRWGSLYHTARRDLRAPTHDLPPLDGPVRIYMGDRA